MHAAQSSSQDECPDEELLCRIALQLGDASLSADASAATEAAPQLRAAYAHVLECSLCAATIESLRPRNDAQHGSDPATLEPATLELGRYVLGRKLGSGASSTVYLAQDTRLGTEVAIKLLRTYAQNHLHQELLIARTISHENVCRVYDAGEADAGAYLAMEYVAGETLTQRLNRGALTASECAAILIKVVAGLAAAHRVRVVHRDLKPQNILLGANGQVVISDFGLARNADAEESRSRLVGTPAYWSPEQARGEPASFASDVYSFGVIAYLLLGGSPYQLRELDPFIRIAPSHRQVVRTCLQANPNARYASALELHAAWIAATTQRPASSRRYWIIGALLVAAAGVIAATVAAARKSETRSALPAPSSANPAAESTAIAIEPRLPSTSSLAERLPLVPGQVASHATGRAASPRGSQANPQVNPLAHPLAHPLVSGAQPRATAMASPAATAAAPPSTPQAATAVSTGLLYQQ